LREMGRQARAWAGQALGWSRIAGQMAQFYEWLLDPSGKSKPDWVRA
jgi:hypothetical protein